MRKCRQLISGLVSTNKQNCGSVGIECKRDAKRSPLTLHPELAHVAVPGAIDRARIRVPKVWALYLQHPYVGVNGTLGLFRGHSTTPRIPTCTRRPMPLRNRPKLRARSNGRRRRTVFRIFSVRIEARETKWLNSGGRCWDRTSDPCLASDAPFQSRRSFSSASLAAPPYALASRRNKFVSSARPSDSIARRASVKS